MNEAVNNGLWLIRTEDGSKVVIWSEPYRISEDKAIAKFRRVAKKLFKKTLKVTAERIRCPVDNCWNFSTVILFDVQRQGLPKAWWIVGDVELTLGDRLEVTTICPMCEKHAHRFRKTLQERVLRIEERLDDLEQQDKDLKES